VTREGKDWQKRGTLLIDRGAAAAESHRRQLASRPAAFWHTHVGRFSEVANQRQLTRNECVHCCASNWHSAPHCTLFILRDLISAGTKHITLYSLYCIVCQRPRERERDNESERLVGSLCATLTCGNTHERRENVQ
jgi:hypothetical protein